MSTGTEAQSTSAALTVQDPVLLASISAVRDWIRDVTEWGFPRFGELGIRLLPLRNILALDVRQRNSATGTSAEACPEVTDGRTDGGCLEKAGADKSDVKDRQQRILEQLDVLIARLQSGEPAFRSWQDAVEQVEWIILEVCRNAQDG